MKLNVISEYPYDIFYNWAHSTLVKRELKVRIPNPHRGDISPYLLAEILRQARISSEKWENA